MNNNARVYNVSRGFTLKHRQALRAIENCAMTWVEFGASVRDLTLTESIAARKRQAAEREPLPLAEVPGLRFQPATGGTQLVQKEINLAREANAWAQREQLA